MPSVAGARTVRTNPLGVGSTKFQAPLTDGFLADHDPALGHHFFDVAKTQAESKVQPHAVADDLDGKAMAFVRADRGDTRRSIHRLIKS